MNFYVIDEGINNARKRDPADGKWKRMDFIIPNSADAIVVPRYYSTEDIVDRIIDRLNGATITVLGIVCHGFPGILSLGRGTLGNGELTARGLNPFGRLRPHFRRLACGAALGAIKITGCAVAADAWPEGEFARFNGSSPGNGYLFLKTLANLTGVAVQASIDGLRNRADVAEHSYDGFPNYRIRTIWVYPDGHFVRLDYDDRGNVA
jgi:hypothetical protein